MPRHIGSGKFCVSHLVIPVSWLFICLALYSLSLPNSFTPPLSFISTSSLSSPVFPCLPPTLLSLFHFTVSRFLSPSLCILMFFSLSSLFFSSLPPTRSKTPPLFILLLSRSLTSLCSFGALILPHHSLLHFSHLCFPSVLYILQCFLLIFSSVAISFSVNNTIFQIFTLIYSICPISQFSLYFHFLLHLSLTFFLPFLFDHFFVSLLFLIPFLYLFLLSTFYRLLSH